MIAIHDVGFSHNTIISNNRKLKHMMNDQYHLQKAKPEKFNHSLTQVILNEAYLKRPLEAID